MFPTIRLGLFGAPVELIGRKQLLVMRDIYFSVTFASPFAKLSLKASRECFFSTNREAKGRGLN